MLKLNENSHFTPPHKSKAKESTQNVQYNGVDIKNMPKDIPETITKPVSMLVTSLLTSATPSLDSSMRKYFTTIRCTAEEC